MNVPTKSSKVHHEQQVMRNQSLDRISMLPDEVLGHILTFLPTTDAVRTMLLSTRWRYLFTLTKKLYFKADDITFGNNLEERNKARKKSFKRFVYKVLASHQISTIEKFMYDCSYMYKDSHLHTWISFAILRGVQKLVLVFQKKQKCGLPDCLFRSTTLTTLAIGGRISELIVPPLACLPRLKVLNLFGVTFEDIESFRRFFTACSLLEELSFTWCAFRFDHHICISCATLKTLAIRDSICNCKTPIELDVPSLSYLDFECSKVEHMGYYLRNMGSLVKASIKFQQHQFHSVPQALELFRACHNVTTLVLLEYSIEYLAWINSDMPTYPNLTSLYLDCCSYDAWRLVFHWLASSPKLNGIVFGKGLVSRKESMESWPQRVALTPFSSPLKVIKINAFFGGKAELVILQHLLNNNSVLQELIIENYDGLTTEEELRLSKELVMLPRASKHCSIKLCPQP